MNFKRFSKLGFGYKGSKSFNFSAMLRLAAMAVAAGSASYAYKHNYLKLSTENNV